MKFLLASFVTGARGRGAGVNTGGVRVFFAHFFKEEFCDGRGHVSRSLCWVAKKG